MPGEAVPAAPPTADEQSDEQIVAALRRGDEQAITSLFGRHSPLMLCIARGYVGSDAIAQEIVQETWLAIISGIERFQGRSTLATWMFSILANQAKTQRARERRTVPFSALAARADHLATDGDHFAADDTGSTVQWASRPRPWQLPERRVMLLEARERLRQALQHLPERQRHVVGLRDVEGRRSDEVCELLALSPENQRVLLHRGRAQLRAELAPYVQDAAA